MIVLGEILALSALAMFSASVLLTKVASSRLELNLGFLVAVTVNVLFCGLLLVVQLLLRHQGPQWSSYGFLLFLSTGFFSTYLGRYLFYDSIVKLGPAKASVMQTSNPLFIVIIAWIFLDENLTPYDVTAVALVLSGLFLVSYVPGTFSTKQIHARSPTEAGQVERLEAPSSRFFLGSLIGSGIFLAISGSASYAVGNVLRGVAIQEWNEPILGALIGAVLGMALHFLTSLHNTKRLFHKLAQADRAGVLVYALTGVLTISAQVCVIASMRYIPVSIANLITLSTPVLVTPASYVLLKNREGITLRTILGSTLVLAGITIILLV